MSLILQFINVVGKLYSVEGTLPGGVYVTETTFNLPTAVINCSISDIHSYW
jgi:hypothetical protein